jgi:FixJ family two-component response regulator
MSVSDGRVFIVDDDESVRVALQRLLRSAGYDVEAFPSAAAYLERPRPEGPACVVLDQRMPGVSGLELQKAITAESAASIVFLTGHGDVPTSVEAMKGGAVDFLTKPVDEGQLVEAVNRALDRSRLTSAARGERRSFLERVARLTPRERQVSALMIRGLLNKQIAWELGTAEKTVKVHRARVMEKLAVGSVAELARLAERTNSLHTDDLSSAAHLSGTDGPFAPPDRRP